MSQPEGRAARSRYLAAVALLALYACAGRTPVEAPTALESPLPALEPQPYRLQAGDTIAVRFWGNPELDEELIVRPDGRISLPFVDEVQAAGLSPAELDAELTRRYAGELATPEITVILRQATGQRIYVGGEVDEQGAVDLAGPMTLLQAIQEAGGFLTSARRKQVLLIRTFPNGRRLARSIDLRPALSGADLSADVTLQPYDIIFVPRTKITNVTLFVEQYINQALPFQPQIYVPVLNEPLLGDNDDQNQ